MEKGSRVDQDPYRVVAPVKKKKNMLVKMRGAISFHQFRS
jgi:hypothetical protein